MHTNDLEAPSRAGDPAMAVVAAVLRDIDALIGELDRAGTKRARRIVAGAHIRATLARRARTADGPKAGSRP